MHISFLFNSFDKVISEKMPRVTRSSLRPDSELKENREVNIIEETKTPKKKILKKRKSPSDDDGSSSDSSSSPPKSSRSNSLSPFRNQFAQLSTGKDTKFRSARRALADNSEFRLPGREKEVSLIKRDNEPIFNSDFL